MEMTTPVFTRKTLSDGEKMEMTAPVITKKVITCRAILWTSDITGWFLHLFLPLYFSFVIKGKEI